jgi:hypothetical protein
MFMRKIGELPLLGTRGQRAVAAGFMALGAAGSAVGFEASGAFSLQANTPPAHEVVVPSTEVFQIAGQLCVNGTVYGVVHKQVQPIPNSGCNENTVSNNPAISVNNG